MRLFPIFRQPLLAALPALLLAAACSKKDEAAPPDQGRISYHHMAASANVGLKFLMTDVEKANLTYGASSGYQTINAGTYTLNVNVATSGTTLNTPKAVTVGKDRSYSAFAYATGAASVETLVVTDDLTAPSTGKAKIRLVHLAFGEPTPIKLSTTAGMTNDIVGTETAFGTASPFITIGPGSYNIAVTTGPASTTVSLNTSTGVSTGNVGDGTGTGAVGNKNYEAGKIYTVVYRGANVPTFAPELQPKVVLIADN